MTLILYFLFLSAAHAQSPSIPRVEMLVDDAAVSELSDPSTAWKQYRPPVDSGEETMWLRLTLEPEAEGSHLFLYPVPRYYEIYQDGMQIYRSSEQSPEDPRTSRLLFWNIVQLDETEEHGQLYIRLEGRAPFMMFADSETDLFWQMLKLDGANLILVIAFTVISAFTLLLYFVNRRMRLLLYYTLFLFLHFVVLLSGTQLLSKQLLFELPPVAYFYWYLIGNFLDFTLLLLLFRQLLPERDGRRVYQLAAVYAGIGIFSVALVSIYPPSYHAILNVTGMISLIGVRLFVLVLSAISLRRHRDSELLIFTIGFAVFVALDLLLSIAMQFVNVTWVYVLKMIQPLAIVVPGAMIIIRHYRIAERKAKDYSDALQRLTEQLQEDNVRLEESVSERTTELEDVHQLLLGHVQEKAAAELEMAALTERNRIAGEIHDIVGHTLTTTIVQLEAGKMLVDKSPDQTRERLEIAQELVRKGLEEIRGSVRLLREAEWSYDLTGALEKLLKETEETAKVEIRHTISDLPELTLEQKNTLYLAAREGLTNGMKHGDSRVFEMQLFFEEPLVIFQLKNDGSPIEGAKQGFGLKAMQQRVEQAGGWLKITADGEWNVILDIRLPV
ncbi:sensor histidine kinase [Marinicrinis lubricantis]|uniref:histidine kinase n=1 Tax=Marinicrinis lubricantis TaxID=2086470 RepID=A0ABW1ITQ7_9BACL